MSFVERVLLLRDTSDVKRFRLSCRVCFSASRVNEWILAAIRRNVQELDLCLFVEEPFALPSCIDAGNLIFFKYSGYLSNKINLYGLSSSALALIHIPNLCGRQREIACRTIKLFGGLRNVSSLRISSGTIESLFLVKHVMDRLPVFENLTLLELRGEFGERSTKLLIKFLQCLPKLESLDFCEGLGRCEDDYRPTSVPNCVLSSLKAVNYRNLHGTNREIWFLKFLLENAIVLEKMNVFWSNSFSS
ncbi:UNVERIFIED_CONTAM: hypothetical protein Sangu_0942700 [Sesamum angustifolium]|uniref:FBD domain-containing protein n=1 Tax=Sesamum angustifolium TaxID=2727405 RepID=A0AAW2PBX6_9LAMI